jgi:hypothetical protein
MGDKTSEKSDIMSNLNGEYNIRNIWFLFRIALASEMSDTGGPDDEWSP